MTLLERLRERLDSDLSDEALTDMIAAAEAEIEKRYGPIGAITVHVGDEREVAAHRRFVHLTRPADAGEPITVVEIEPGNSGDAANETALAANDWRLQHGGRVLERLVDGANGRMYWANLVRITYTPTSDGGQRDEAIVQLVQLAAQYRGLSSERAGDWAASYPADAIAERDRILASLAPRPLPLA